jgi:glycerol-3-phosphate dehydrogenase
MPKHAMVSRAQALKDIPSLTPAVVAVATYYDAKVSMPERLVLELVADGLEANPHSAALNYAPLHSHKDGVISIANPEGGVFTVRPRIVVNAAGPWIDGVNAVLGHHAKIISGTKGSHLLLKHDELVRSLAGRMIYYEADDGRVCLVYGYFGLALVGSTDIPADDPDNVRCDDSEVGYLIESLSALCPSLHFDRSQIVYAYSGIRPLPVSDVSLPGLVSRDHSSPTIEPGGERPFPIVSLVGGKWTTFRGLAEEVADNLLARLGRARRVSTAELPIGGGRGYPIEGPERDAWLAEASATTGVAYARLAILLDRYGTTALSIARHIASFVGERPLAHAPNYTRAEIDYLARFEAVERLTDIVLRRTMLAMTGALDHADLDEIASLLGDALGWSESRRADEISVTATELSERHFYRFS